MKTFLFSTLLVVFLFTVSMSAQVKIEESNFVQSGAGQTVLLGTYVWNAEADNFPLRGTPEEKTSDVWWEQIDDRRQKLVPFNGASLAEVRERTFDNLGGRNFDQLTVEDLKALPYSKKSVSNEFLIPDAVFAIRTAEGNYVKLKVVGFRALHDFSFKEAAVLRENWKQMVLNKPDQEKYHLEVEWVLYTKQ